MNTQRSVSRYGTSGGDRGLGLSQDALRHLDARGIQRRRASRAATLHGAALGQHFACWPAAGSVDTEIGLSKELEDRDAAQEVLS